MKSIDIIVPVRNEEKNVEELTYILDKSLKNEVDEYKLIFVIDPSTDKTADVLDKLSKTYPIIKHYKQGKPGKGYSLVEGVELATSEYVAFIDGDLQYPAEIIPEMLRTMENDEIGVVVANRRKYNSNIFRKVGSRLNKIIFGNLLLGLDCDIQSGLKLFRKSIFKYVDTSLIGPWTFDIPLLHTAKHLGYKIGSVEIDYVERKDGISKVKYIQTAISIASCAIKISSKDHGVYHLDDYNDINGKIMFKKNLFTPHSLLPHHKSALFTTMKTQKLIIIGVFLTVILTFLLYPLNTAIFLISILSFIYFSDVLFSIYLILKSLHNPPELSFTNEEIKSINEDDLPIYSVLCPLYNEPEVLPQFVTAMEKMDYPKTKLDVLILLEQNDTKTITVANEMKLPAYVKVIVVPHSQPKTKPKACNYGIQFAKGKYMVVYDAEDVPEPKQLKKGYLAFNKVGKNVICVQAKLNYYNPHQNLLTTLFTAEYSLWFDVILPGLQSINTIIPLGGTSNHFRTEDLKRLHAWDPFNVTEDCDLGVRLFKDGYKTEIMDSTTLEEANSDVKNWIRQRSRWIKGYLQTYLVHMRDPIKFFKQHKWHALIFQLIIGLRISFILINPILWATTISYFVFYEYVGSTIESLYPTPVFYMAAISLVFGNFIYLYNYMIGLAKRGHWDIIKFVFIVPFYWAMMGISALVAFHQLIFKPHFWEKTHHGLHFKKITGANEPRAITILLTKFKNILPNVKKLQILAGGLLIAAAMLANVINFITNAYLGRNLDAAEFGLIALLSSFLFLAQIPAAGVDQTISHQTAFIFGRYGQPLGLIWKKYRPKLTFLSISLSILWIILIPITAKFFNSVDLLPFLIFAPVWSFLLLNAADSGYLQGSHKFHYLALLTLAGALSKLLFSILFVKLGFSYYVYAALPMSLLTVLGIGWLLARKTANSYASEIDDKELKKAINFSKKFFATSILTKLSSISFLSLDLIFVKHFLTSVETGQYALLVLVGRMVYMIGGLFTQFILPLVSKQEGNGHKNNRAFYFLLLGVFVSTFVIFIVVGILGHVTVPILFGDKTIPILHYLIPFSFSMVLFSMGYSLVIYHQAKKEYIFALPGVATIFFQAGYLIIFHSNIQQIVLGMLLSASFYLVIALALHFLKNHLITMVINIRDVLSIVKPLKPIIRARKSDEDLKILIMNWRDTKHIWAGGAEVYIHEMAKRWVNNGAEVTVFCGNDRKCPNNDIVDGVRIVRRGGFYTVYLWAFFYYIFKFKGKFDLVIDCENGIPFFTPLYVKEPVIGLVHHVHRDLFFKELKLPKYLLPVAFIAQQMESVLMPVVYKNTQMVTVSESSKNDMEKIGFGINIPIKIANPGVDLKNCKVGKKYKTPTILYLGRLKPYKSIDTLIKAAVKVAKEFPNVRVIIAGFGESKDYLEKLAKKLGVTKNVLFTGKVTEREKLRLLQSSWIFVQPSSMEGWGISVIEANACGTPAVASKVPGLVDSVKHGYSGLTIEPNNEHVLAETLIELLKDETLLKTLSSNAISWAAQFDWDITSNVFRQYYRELFEITNENTNIANNIKLELAEQYESKE